MNRFLTRFFKTNCSKEPVLWNESDFTPPASKSNVNVSRFLNTITRSRCLPYFMDPIINKDNAFACALPKNEFQSSDIIYYSTCPSWSRSQSPKPEPDISLNYPCTRSVRLCVRSHCCSRNGANTRETEESHTNGAAEGDETNPTLIIYLTSK